MAQGIGLFERFERMDRKKRRVYLAFLVAPLLSMSVFVTFLVIAVPIFAMSGSFQPYFILFWLGGLLAGWIPAVISTLVLAVPAYNVMARFDAISTKNVLLASTLVGAFSGYILAVPFRAMDLYPDDPLGHINLAVSFKEFSWIILPLGAAGSLGGLVFCRMTIWRKPETDQATDGMGNCP